jgi:hypothetical protein
VWGTLVTSAILDTVDTDMADIYTPTTADTTSVSSTITTITITTTTTASIITTITITADTRTIEHQKDHPSHFLFFMFHESGLFMNKLEYLGFRRIDVQRYFWKNQ